MAVDYLRFKEVTLVLSVLVGLALGTQGQGAGDLTCLKCDHVNSPEECDTFGFCGHWEVCFTRQIVDHNDKIAYRLGCESPELCELYKQAEQIFGRRRRSLLEPSDSIPHYCFDCCADDYCNYKLCKNKPPITGGVVTGMTASTVSTIASTVSTTDSTVSTTDSTVSTTDSTVSTIASTVSTTDSTVSTIATNASTTASTVSTTSTTQNASASTKTSLSTHSSKMSPSTGTSATPSSTDASTSTPTATASTTTITVVSTNATDATPTTTTSNTDAAANTSTTASTAKTSSTAHTVVSTTTANATHTTATIVTMPVTATKSASTPNGCPNNHFRRVGPACYLFDMHTITWDQARKSCQQQGADLISMNTAEEDQRIVERLTRMDTPDTTRGVWIGGFFNETTKKYQWVDGSDITYNRYMKRSPRDKAEYRLLMINPSVNPLFSGWPWSSDVGAFYKRGFICEAKAV